MKPGDIVICKKTIIFDDTKYGFKKWDECYIHKIKTVYQIGIGVKKQTGFAIRIGNYPIDAIAPDAVSTSFYIGEINYIWEFFFAKNELRKLKLKKINESRR